MFLLKGSLWDTYKREIIDVGHLCFYGIQVKYQLESVTQTSCVGLSGDLPDTPLCIWIYTVRWVAQKASRETPKASLQISSLSLGLYTWVFHVICMLFNVQVRLFFWDGFLGAGNACAPSSYPLTEGTYYLSVENVIMLQKSIFSPTTVLFDWGKGLESYLLGMRNTYIICSTIG